MTSSRTMSISIWLLWGFHWALSSPWPICSTATPSCPPSLRITTPRNGNTTPTPSRFITRYFKVGFQECYEVHLHNIWEAAKVSEMRQLKAEVKRQMAIEGDYKGWYHRADIAHYSRQRKEMEKEMTEARGHGTSWH